MSLVVKALLFGPNVAALETEGIDNDNDNKDEDEDTCQKKQAKAWRALGAIGKVHNITKHVRRTPQHRQTFINQQLDYLKGIPAFMLRADNDTRWNSTHDMISDAIKQEDHIKMYTNSMDELADDKLTDIEWGELKEVKKLLSPFEQLTQYVQGKDSSQGSITLILPGMDILLSHLEKAKENSRPTSIAFRTAIRELLGLMTSFFDEICQESSPGASGNALALANIKTDDVDNNPKS
jgi:hypothetical protein